MAVSNIYAGIEGQAGKLTAKSTTRSIQNKPVVVQGKGAFDNFKETTELSRKKLEIIQQFLSDYKKTYTELEKNPETAAFIRDKRERNELSKALADKLYEATESFKSCRKLQIAVEDC